MADILVNNPSWQQFASALEQDRGLPSGLLAAVAHNETAGGHPDLINATSSAGAQGMYQFEPATAKQYNVNTKDAADSTRGAADYLGDLQKKYKDPLLAGAAYDWGPGNLDTAIKAAKGAGIPTDAVSLAQHGFLPKETAAYVVKLSANMPQPTGPQPFAPEVVEQTRKSVADMAASGTAPATIIQNLSKTQVAPMIEHLLSAGLSPEDIIKQVGGDPLAKVQAAQDKVQQQNFLTNMVQGGENAVGDMVHGGQQLVARATGDDAHLQQLQQEEAARDADPERQALSSTAGGTVGDFGVKALPFVAGSIVAPEATIPLVATNAAIGGAEGALTPTTGSGQIGKNILTQAALGGAGAGAGVLGGKLAGKVLSSAGNGLSKLATPAVDAEAAQKALAQAVGEKIGVPGAERIDSDLINAADAVHQPMFEAAAQGNTVTVPKGFSSTVSDIADNLNTTPKALTNLLSKVKDGDQLSAEQWLKYRSDIGANTRAATGKDAKYLGDIINQLDDTLQTSSSLTQKQIADLAQARQFYRNLQPVEQMVKASNNSGTVNASQFTNAVKQAGGTDAFSRGAAPLQDIQHLADKLPKAGGKASETDDLFPTYAIAETLGHIIPGVQPLIMAGKYASKALKGAGGKPLATAGTKLTGVGNAIANQNIRNALIGSLIAKGLGPK